MKACYFLPGWAYNLLFVSKSQQLVLGKKDSGHLRQVNVHHRWEATVWQQGLPQTHPLSYSGVYVNRQAGFIFLNNVTKCCAAKSVEKKWTSDLRDSYLLSNSNWMESFNTKILSWSASAFETVSFLYLPSLSSRSVNCPEATMSSSCIHHYPNSLAGTWRRWTAKSFQCPACWPRNTENALCRCVSGHCHHLEPLKFEC